MTWYCVGLVAFIDEFTFEVCHFIGIALGSDLSAATMAYHGATCHGLRVEWVKRARGGEGAGNKVEEYRLPQLLGKLPLLLLLLLPFLVQTSAIVVGLAP